MFARQVSFRLKPNSIPEFTKTIEQEVLPLLRKEKGFRDEITFVAPSGTEAIGISNTYPAVLKALTKVVEGTPELKTFEVGNSTFPKIAARAARA